MPSTQWFNTGVRYCNVPTRKLGEFEKWIDGILHIAFILEYAPPENARLMYLCDNPPVSILSILIVDGGLLSKFAVYAI